MPPFFLTFFLSLLIILMQFLWKYVDDLVGKGLEWYLILKLLFYASATFVSLALPLAVLLSSLMTFGNLGEKYEIVAMKSAGISVLTLMKPLAFISLLIACFSFWFTDTIVPEANVKLRTLLYEIREQKPTLSIDEGVFYDGLGDYTIRIGKKHRDNENIEDILIYDYSKRQGNITGTYANRGTMSITPDKKHFVFTLYDGYFWDESRNQNSGKSTCPFVYAKFDKQYMRIDLSSFEMQKVDESFFKSNNKSLTLNELTTKIDTMYKELDEVKGSVSRKFYDQAVYYRSYIMQNDSRIPDSILPTKIDISQLSPQQRGEVLDYTKRKARDVLGCMTPAYEVYELNKMAISLYEIEWHRKWVLPLACFLFFFIGAPLGTIIRKGGIGVPLVITVAFFAFYFVISIIGEKMAKTNDIPVWVGMWLSTFVVFPMGIYLTYKAAIDSAVLSPEAYAVFFKKITRIFKKK